MSAFNGYVQAKFHGGTMAGGPTFTVVHDAETPLRAGYADSITEFFRKGPAAGTSAHAMVGPEKAVKLLPDNVVAYAAGPKANPRGWHVEQAGYASFTRAQWTTDDGLAQLQRVAACLREIHDTWGIPKRWVTDDQLRRAAVGDKASGGMTTHQQVARVLGGTTHTDPQLNYPRDLLLAAVLNGDDDMPSAEEIARAVWRDYPITGRDVNGVLGKGVTSPEMLLASIPRDVLQAQVPNEGRRANGEKDATTSVATQTEWADAQVAAVLNRVSAVEEKLDEVLVALKAANKT